MLLSELFAHEKGRATVEALRGLSEWGMDACHPADARFGGPDRAKGGHCMEVQLPESREDEAKPPLRHLRR